MPLLEILRQNSEGTSYFDASLKPMRMGQFPQPSSSLSRFVTDFTFKPNCTSYPLATFQNQNHSPSSILKSWDVSLTKQLRRIRNGNVIVVVMKRGSNACPCSRAAHLHVHLRKEPFCKVVTQHLRIAAGKQSCYASA